MALAMKELMALTLNFNRHNSVIGADW